MVHNKDHEYTIAFCDCGWEGCGMCNPHCPKCGHKVRKLGD